MFNTILSFFENWLGLSYGAYSIPLPLTDNTIDLLLLVSTGVLIFCICWVLYIICKIINSFLSIF